MLNATGSAVTALFNLLSAGDDGSAAPVTGTAAMGAINALKSLTVNPTVVPVSAADQSVNAASSVASSAASSTDYTLSRDDLTTLLDLLGNAQAISSGAVSAILSLPFFWLIFPIFYYSFSNAHLRGSASAFLQPAFGLSLLFLEGFWGGGAGKHNNTLYFTRLDVWNAHGVHV